MYKGPEYAFAEAATWEVFWKIGVLISAVKILEKYLWRSSFLVTCRLTVRNFQSHSLRFLPNKEICQNCVFRWFFSYVKNFRERDCATLLKTNFFKDIFQGFWLKISPGNFQNSCLWEHLFFKNISMAASELCLPQLDYSLHCVFNFPHLLFCRVYPGHQVQLS